MRPSEAGDARRIELCPRPARVQRADGARPWHRHRASYAALVLEGGYLEIGIGGRCEAAPGMAVMHAPFDAHANRFRPGGARLINLPVPPACAAGAVAIDDPDLIVRIAARSPMEAGLALCDQARPLSPATGDWPDLLAEELRACPALALADWARAHGLAPETLSRGFRRCFGLSPREFRAEVRLRRAMAAMRDPGARLCDIAIGSGYADQPHMTRAVRSAIGETPAKLRREGRGPARSAVRRTCA